MYKRQGSRHTTTLAGDKLYVLGASDSGTFRDVHALDIETLTWSPVEAGGQPPIARSRHTSTLVGRNLNEAVTFVREGRLRVERPARESRAAIAELVAHFRDADGVPASVDVGHYAYDGGEAPE